MVWMMANLYLHPKMTTKHHYAQSTNIFVWFPWFMEKLILSSHNDEKTGGPCEMSGERQVPCVNPQLNGIVPRVHPHHALRSKKFKALKRLSLFTIFNTIIFARH